MRLLKKKSLLAIVNNSIKGGNNHTYRNLFFNKKGRVVDVLNNGSDSCAVFVSWILLALELIKKPHTTVDATIIDLMTSGWYMIKKPKLGAVIVWTEVKGRESGLRHSHIGFYIGRNYAISNSSHNTGFPHKHHYTYNDTRDIEAIYWHSELDKG